MHRELWEAAIIAGHWRRVKNDVRAEAALPALYGHQTEARAAA